MATIIIDPGHGGDVDIGGSDANHAVSPSGVTEKSITLDLAKRIRWSLTQSSGHAHAKAAGKTVEVVLTRDTDTNLSLDQRAAKAAEAGAELYLSLHCNGWDGTVRGTEAYIDRKYLLPVYQLSAGRKVAQEGPGDRRSGLRNVNVDEDAAFAHRIVTATVEALTPFDPGARYRSARYSAAQHGEAFTPPKGVKMLGLGTLRDAKLGTSSNDCRACLLELEFIDHPKVDQLLNGAKGMDVRNSVAAAIAKALVDSLGH